MLYLGEINDSRRAAWCRSVEVVEGAQRSKQVALFPEDRGARELDCEVVQIRLAELTLLSRLNHAVCTLSVYASQPGSPPDRATRFRLVASFDRSKLSPAGSRRWFPSCLSVYTASSIIRLCLAQSPITDAFQGQGGNIVILVLHIS